MSKSRLNSGWLAAIAASLMLSVGIGFGLSGRVSGQDSNAKSVPKAVENANSLSLAFRQAAETATPTVVKIRSHTNSKPVAAERRGGRGNRPQGPNPFEGTPFEDFFGEGGQGMDQFNGRIPERDGVGSGVIVDKSGIVLTNNHVVEGADEVTVHLPDGREFRATDIKTDPESDLAVLRIKSESDLPAAKLGDSDTLEIGDWVLAIGNPFSLDTTVSAGIISGKERELSTVRRAKFLQTDAAINPGNSGGPLVNLNGEVVGINTAIASSSGGYQGIGFAIPANQVKWIMDQLIKTGSVQRGYLGVGIQELNNGKEFGYGVDKGVLVTNVFPDSPAGAAGIEEDDVIVEFAGKKVSSPRELQDQVERAELDRAQPVTVLRDGKRRTVEVTIKSLPNDLLTRDQRSVRPRRGAARSDSYHAEELGLTVSELSAEVAQQLGIQAEDGVLITEVEPEGLAAEKGLTSGMVIRRLNRKPVTSLDEFKSVLEDISVEDGVLLHLRAGDGNRVIVLD